MTAGIGLRQVTEEDRWLFWQWRNSERIRRVSTQDSEISPESHAAWFDRGFPTMRDRNIMVTWNDAPAGWFQIEGWSDSDRSGEWGLGLGVFPSTPGLGGALPLLALGHAFERLDAAWMTARVLALNTNMASIMKRLGLPVDAELTEPLQRADGSTTTVLLYRVAAAEWPAVRSAGLALLPSALRSAVAVALDSPVAG